MEHVNAVLMFQIRNSGRKGDPRCAQSTANHVWSFNGKARWLCCRGVALRRVANRLVSSGGNGRRHFCVAVPPKLAESGHTQQHAIPEQPILSDVTLVGQRSFRTTDPFHGQGVSPLRLRSRLQLLDYLSDGEGSGYLHPLGANSDWSRRRMRVVGKGAEAEPKGGGGGDCVWVGRLQRVLQGVLSLHRLLRAFPHNRWLNLVLGQRRPGRKAGRE